MNKKVVIFISIINSAIALGILGWLVMQFKGAPSQQTTLLKQEPPPEPEIDVLALVELLKSSTSEVEISETLRTLRNATQLEEDNYSILLDRLNQEAWAPASKINLTYTIFQSWSTQLTSIEAYLKQAAAIITDSSESIEIRDSTLRLVVEWWSRASKDTESSLTPEHTEAFFEMLTKGIQGASEQFARDEYSGLLFYLSKHGKLTCTRPFDLIYSRQHWSEYGPRIHHNFYLSRNPRSSAGRVS